MNEGRRSKVDGINAKYGLVVLISTHALLTAWLARLYNCKLEMPSSSVSTSMIHS